MQRNYQEITIQLTTDKVIELLRKLGAEVVNETDNYLVFPTICHNDEADEASAKLYYYKDSHLFMCFTECGTMTIFSLLQHYYETRHLDYEWYEDVYLIAMDCSSFREDEGFVTPSYKGIKERYVTPRVVKKLPEFSKGVLDCFDKFYPPEWLAEGITTEAMDKFDIRYSISQNKIIIPHYDSRHRLVGIRGRALNPDEIELYGKYAPICVEGVWYKHPLSLNLYGLDKTRRTIKDKGICYVLEGEKSVLMLQSWKGFANCGVAICGSNFNKYALKILLKEARPNEIVLCLDNEEKPGRDDYFNKLYSICDKYKEYCNFSFIYDRANLTNKKDAPVDKGPEIFKQLLRERVKVR